MHCVSQWLTSSLLADVIETIAVCYLENQKESTYVSVICDWFVCDVWCGTNAFSIKSHGLKYGSCVCCQVSNHSRVTQERHLRLTVHKVRDLPSTVSQLVSWVRNKFHAVTTLRSLTSANSATLRVGPGLSVPSVCAAVHFQWITHSSFNDFPCFFFIWPLWIYQMWIFYIFKSDWIWIISI